MFYVLCFTYYVLRGSQRRETRGLGGKGKGERGKGKGSSSYIVFGFQFSVKSKDGFRHVPE
jgi:hypothetical protein